MNIEDVLHIYNGTLLSHKKAWNWVICRDLGGPRVWHTKPSRKPHFKRAGWGADVTLIITKQLKITVVHNDVNVAHATELFSIAAAPLPFFSRSVQSLSRIQCFATPWSAARQASLSFPNSQSLLKFMSIKLAMPANHSSSVVLFLSCLQSFPASGSFFKESALYIRWPKYWSFSFSSSLSNEHPGLISLKIDWLDLLAVQGTLKSLLQHPSSKASILQHSAFFTVQLSHPYMTTGKTIALIRRTFVSIVSDF